MLWFQRLQRLLTSSPGQTFRILTFELIVVVLGILIAFQIEEWRENRANLNEERRILGVILEDIIVGESELDLWQQAMVSNLRALDPLMKKISRGGSATNEEIEFFLNNGFRRRLWRPTSPGFSGARDAGKLPLIQNRELIRQLVAYFDIAEGYYLDFRIELDSRQNRLQQMLDPVVKWHSPNGNVDDLKKTLAIPPETFPQTRETQNELTRYWQQTNAAVRIINGAKKRLTERRLSIEAILNRTSVIEGESD